MSDFLYPVYIPLLKDNLYFKELTNKQYKNLVKTILNDDILCFNMFVDTLLKELCPDIEIGILSAFDKFYILCILRISNVGPKLEFTVQRKKNDNITFNVDLVELIDRMDSFDFKRKWELVEDGITIVVTIPKQFSYDNDIYACVYNCIEQVKFDDKNIQLYEYPLDEKKHIMSKLPGIIIPKVISLLKDQDTIISKEPFIDIKIDQEVPFDKQLYLSFFNNSFYEMVKLAYSITLKDFYVYEYNLIKKFKFSYDQINSITPAELQVYFSVISEDIEREKQEKEKQQNSDQYHAPPVQNMQHT
tara:strand:+ start:2261 stop:3169 length:909 start_codon:yes stop_codon:yes gene_type:complete